MKKIHLKRRKKNIRMKRRARKTAAVILLITAIVVAAIPVPGSSAGSDTTDYATDPNYSASGVNVTNGGDTEPWSITTDRASNVNSFPVVQDSDKIFTDETGAFQFAYIPPNASISDSGRIAVIVNANTDSKKVVNNNNLTIPSTFDGYLQFTVTQGTGNGQVAVDIDGNFLFYKYITKQVITRKYQYINGVEQSSPYSSEGPVNEESYVELVSNKLISTNDDPTVEYIQDSEGNITEAIKKETYYVYRYLPCYSNDDVLSTWDVNDVCLYRYTDMSHAPAVDNNTYCLNPTYIAERNANSTILTPDTGYNGSSAYTEDSNRVKDALVQYISSKHAIPDGSTNGYVLLDDTSRTSATINGNTINYTGVFAEKNVIHSVTIPDTIYGIGDHCFEGCTALSNVTFDGGISCIGAAAFKNCSNLNQVNFGATDDISASNLTEIAQEAFYGCRSLPSFKFTSGIQRICNNAFNSCTSLTDLDFSQTKNLTKLGQYVFANCTALKEVELPQSLLQVGWGTFQYDTALETLKFSPPDYYNNTRTSSDSTEPTETTSSGAVNVINIPANIFYGVGSSLKHLVVYKPNWRFVSGGSTGTPATYDLDDVRTAASEEFYIEGYFDYNGYTVGADYGSQQGSYSYYQAKQHHIAYKFIETGFFEKYIANASDQGGITYTVNDAGELVDVVCDPGVTEVVIPSTIGPYEVNTIGTDFHYNYDITSITIPATITNIAAGAFEGCRNLRDVTFEDANATSNIGPNAFNTQCLKDESYWNLSDYSATPTLTFHGGIDASYAAFDYAMRPENTINNAHQATTYIVYSAGDPSYIDVQYNPDTDKNTCIAVPKIGTTEFLDHVNDAISKSSANGTLTASDAVQMFGTTSKDSLPNNVKDVINAAYNIILPSGVEAIANGLFSDADLEHTGQPGIDAWNNDFTETAAKMPASGNINDQVKSITMFDVQQIEPYAFYGCTNLEKVTMYPSHANAGEHIGEYAFGKCAKLSEVQLPVTTDKIGTRPFAACPGLTDISFVAASNPDSANSGAANGNNYSYNSGLLFETANGVNTKIVECLETRGNNANATSSIGSTTISGTELAGIKEIYPEAFMNCQGIGTVNLENSQITSIPQFAFDNCSSLAYVTLPDSNKRIEAYGFKDTAIKNILIPTTTTYFDSAAFYSTKASDNGVINYVEVSTSEGSAAETLAESYSKYHWSLGEYVLPTFTVNFYDIDNTLLDSQTVRAGEDAVDPTTKEGFVLPSHDEKVFTGWDRSLKGIGMNMSIYATYSDESFTVTFRDWDYNTILATRQYVAKGSSVELPRDPVRDGYTFTGWMVLSGSASLDCITEDTDAMAQYSFGTTTPGPDVTTDPYATPTPVPGTTSTPGPGTTATPGPGASASPSASSSPGATGSPYPSGDDDGTKYTLTVINGSGSGSYVAGTTVVVAAYLPNNGYAFYNWTSSKNDLDFSSTTLSAATFTMPAQNLTVTANYMTVAIQANYAYSSANTSKNAGQISSAPHTNTGSNSSKKTKDDDDDDKKKDDDGTKVQVNRTGISDADLASATVAGSSDDFVVKISETGEATAEVAAALINEYGDLSPIRYFAMDISLYDETGTTKITDTSGLAVTITIPIPDELRSYAGNNQVAGVVNSQLDKLTPRFSTVDNVPCITFTATHFSPYTVYVDTNNLTAGVSDATPKTGDPIHPKWFLAIALACLSVVLFLKKDKKVRIHA